MQAKKAGGLKALSIPTSKWSCLLQGLGEADNVNQFFISNLPMSNLVHGSRISVICQKYQYLTSFTDLFRGCYKGEYNVNPNKLGCSKQNGDVYCFCKGDKCNNAGVQGFGKGGRRY